MGRSGHVEDPFGRPCWCGEVHNWSGTPPEPMPGETVMTPEVQYHLMADTDPASCTCGHNGLPAVYHRLHCACESV